jgi:hypothetical protein
MRLQGGSQVQAKTMRELFVPHDIVAFTGAVLEAVAVDDLPKAA